MVDILPSLVAELSPLTTDRPEPEIERLGWSCKTGRLKNEAATFIGGRLPTCIETYHRKIIQDCGNKRGETGDAEL